ncbi:hypothetical protein [Paludibacterium purpuratum]|uniref:Uncharacterized protein n=1 Tax=Paludibacterium purpuratum TaxID=1144873 RepID=A0A4R7B934_9NEIS|nr:hypothetical protein [Paludibacterium purpuratum]TDR81364.1 hypothetical protein DFP86_10317 [Paludibacterium purpuratum]
MSQAWLSYDKAPPIWLPMRFFLAALGWLAVLTLTLAVATPQAPNRFQPLTVALTHELALGVLGNIMLGAALQLLAVLAGLPLKRPARMLWLVWLPWQAGSGLLCAGFATGFAPRLLSAGGFLLVLALAGLLGHGIVGLLRSPARDSASRGMLLALSALALAATLGLAMVATLSGHTALPLLPLMHSHVLWAGIGWLLGLLIAISQTVVPMFLITPPYPRAVRWLSAGLLPLLAAIAVFTFWPLPGTDALALALWLGVSAYGLLTLRLLRQGRRPQDPARAQWLRAMLSLLAAALLALSCLAWPTRAELPLLAGFLWLGGLGLGVMLAMLGKIVPFLCWLHLKAQNPPRGLLPSTHGFLSETHHRRVGMLHVLWVAAGVLWCLAPQSTQWLFAAASALLAGTLAWLGLRIANQYRAVQQQIQASRIVPTPSSPPH